MNNTRAGWFSTVGGFLSTTVSSGVVTIFVFGIFAPALGKQFGWSREFVHHGLSMCAIGTGIGSVCLGYAMDQWGVRRATAGMVLLFGVSLFCIASLPESPALYIAMMFAAGFMAAAATPSPYSLAVSASLTTTRGLALGIINAGNGLGGVLIPLLARHLLAQYGWRVGFMGVAVVVAALPMLALWLLVRLPENYEATRLERRKLARENADPLLKIMKTSPQFWILVFAVFCTSIATFGALSQTIEILRDRKVQMAAIATIMGAASLSSTCSRVGVGFLLDRFFAPYVTSVVFGLVAVGIFLITSGGANDTQLVFGAALLGVGLGAEADLMAYLVSRYFSIYSFGRVNGALWLFFCWGGAAGMYLLNACLSITGSYQFALYSFVAVNVMGLLMILRLGPYKFALNHQKQVLTEEQTVAVAKERNGGLI